jgi:hypothetical protein
VGETREDREKDKDEGRRRLGRKEGDLKKPHRHF